MPKHSIPAFSSVEEEAKWWDTHDVMDYPEDIKSITKRPARAYHRVLTIRLTDEMDKKLRTTAEGKGVGPTTLARMWIVEHLKGV